MTKLLPVVSLVALGCLTAGAYEIYPVPQKITTSQTVCSFPSSVNIVASQGINETTVNRAREVLTSVGVATITTSATPGAGCDLIIGVNGSGDTADRLATTKGLSRSVFDGGAHKFDPHIVSLTSDGDFLVVGDSEGSAYYGLATLQQVMEQAGGGSLPLFTVEDYSHTRYRGVVEGFYGHPFSIESRNEIFEYFKRYKLNYYLYAPKADPYHAGKWREAYPTTVTDDERNLGQITQDDLRQIAQKARECNIDFVWAVHPALGGPAISFWNLDAGVDDIMKKFATMYELGIRHFGVSIDDMTGHPSTQWQLGDKVQKAVDNRYNTPDVPEADRVGHVIFVPTQYALNYDRSYSSLSPFKNADPNLEIAFTGYDCFSNVRDESFSQMASIVGRDPIFWWNNPVNDDYDEFLYMHGLSARWAIEPSEPVDNIRGFLLNPMNQGQASKICFFNAADYSWNPRAYDEPTSWKAAVASLGHTPEMTDALHEFIRCLSAYTTHDTRTPEGEEYAELFTKCTESINSGKTDGFEELRERMTATSAACLKLHELKDSELSDQRLLYVDIEPWLNKVEEMANIILHSLDMIEGNASLEHWTDFFTLGDRAAAIHKDKRYQHSVLEGHGTSTYEVWREVQPTPKYMDNFVDFIAGAVEGYTPSLPAIDRSPRLITNLEDTPQGAAVTAASDTELLLEGLADIRLPYSYYVGINFGTLTSVTLREMPQVAEGLEVETSVNGKYWTPLDEEVGEMEIAYLRIRNPQQTDTLAIGADRMRFTIPVRAAVGKPEVSTNMTAYQTYTIDKVIDGDPSTHFWSNGRQKEGDYIMLDFGTSAMRTNVALTFTGGDLPQGPVSIQISDDGDSWQDILNFTKEDIGADQRYAGSLGNVSARYVRLYFGPISTTYWFQLAEFEVEGYEASTVAVATDQAGNAIYNINDNSLATAFKPATAGWLIYRFTENLAMEQVQLFHNSQFSDDVELPQISLRESGDDDWSAVGHLREPRTVVETADYPMLEQMKIEWNEVNRPSIYEVLPVGSLYVEAPEKPEPPVEPEPEPPVEPDPVGINGVTAGGNVALTVAMTGDVLRVECGEEIASVRLTAIDGRLISVSRPASRVATLPCRSGMAVMEVTTITGKRIVVKI